MTPNSYPALILNADYRPLFPLVFEGWQDAVKRVLSDRVDTLETYDREVHSQGSALGRPFSMRLPSVLALRVYQRQDRPVAFTRAGVLLRAEGKCAYCSCKLTMRDMTFDHVVPQSAGGRTSWMNCVAACNDCNSLKANKPLARSGLELRAVPYVPNRMQMSVMALKTMAFSAPRMHPTWHAYLGIQPDAVQSGAAMVGEASGSESVFPADMSSEAYWNAELDAE
jgi:5-methylcytosine-specific restriction endonuclease McrA